ncbi:MAG: hypothetical protein MUO62_06350 [Anaerolineales bacterium]|nr:hypothetical protein [Anaerolineales bacterium]
MTEYQQLSPKRDSTRLYTRKADVYARSRPDYLPKAFAIFQEMVRLPGHSVVMDVGNEDDDPIGAAQDLK